MSREKIPRINFFEHQNLQKNQQKQGGHQHKNQDRGQNQRQKDKPQANSRKHREKIPEQAEKKQKDGLGKSHQRQGQRHGQENMTASGQPENPHKPKPDHRTETPTETT